MKPCSRCGGPLDGRHKSYCRACAAEYARQNRAKRGDKARKYSREYRKQYLAKYPEKRVQYARKSSYGLTNDEFIAMFTAQSGRCAICHTPLVEGKGKDCLAIDHDHVTGEVRGLLCQGCNSLLGYAQDSSSILFSAIQYLGGVVEQVDTATLNTAAKA